MKEKNKGEGEEIPPCFFMLFFESLIDFKFKETHSILWLPHIDFSFPSNIF